MIPESSASTSANVLGVNIRFVCSVMSSGSQLNFPKMLSYETQLDLKRNVIVKAYQNFSGTFYLATT